MDSSVDKQKVVDEIAAILEIDRDELGNGSKEHLKLLQDIAAALDLVPTGEKHVLAERIVTHLGGEWTRDCYSRGSSVQTHAFLIIRDALRTRIGVGRAAFMLGLAVAKAAVREGDAPPSGNPTPSRLTGSDSDFERCPAVVAWVLMKACGHCEHCGAAAPFNRGDGSPYLEVHHVQPLAEGGPDIVGNAVALCPTCHRGAHHAADRRDRRNQLRDRLEGRGYASPSGD